MTAGIEAITGAAPGPRAPTRLPHSIRCWCDGCGRSRQYLDKLFPDPEVTFKAFTVLNPESDPDDVHALTQSFIRAYKDVRLETLGEGAST